MTIESGGMSVLLGGDVYKVYRCDSCQNLHVALYCDETFPPTMMLASIPAVEWAEHFMKLPEFKFEVEQILKRDGATKPVEGGVK